LEKWDTNKKNGGEIHMDEPCHPALREILKGWVINDNK